MRKILILLMLCFLVSGCATNDPAVEDEKMTLGQVQREIKIGMSSADVVEILGSPNMVTTDDQRRETWVYDKVSSQVSSSNSGAGVWLLVFSAGGSTNKTTTSQRTLTIIIKFDNQGKVRDFAYRSSTF